MSEPFDLDRFIEEVLTDPGRAAEIERHRAENRVERARYLEHSLITILASTARAALRSGAARDEVIEGTTRHILDDPGLVATLVAAIDDELDTLDNEERFDQIQAAIYAAIDPHTSRLSDAFALAPDLQAVVDGDPDLQVLVAGLLDTLPRDTETRSDAFAKGLAGIVERYDRPRRVSELVIHHDEDEIDANEVEHAFVLHGPGDDHHAAALLAPGDLFTRYLEDPDGLFRLGESRIYEGNDRYTVLLRAYIAGTLTPLVQSREEWRPIATLDRERLEIEPDTIEPDPWKLVRMLSAAELDRIQYEVVSGGGSTATERD